MAAIPARSRRSASSPGSVVTVKACLRKPSACSCEPRAIARSAAAASAIRAWRAERVGLARLARVLVGREVVAGERARELVGPERLEEPGGGEVAGLAVAPGERVVGDLADERLDERVLAALRAARVGARVSSSRRTSARSRGSSSASCEPGHGGQPGEGEALAEDRGVGDERAVGRRRASRREAMRAVSVSGTASVVRSPSGR